MHGHHFCCVWGQSGGLQTRRCKVLIYRENPEVLLAQQAKGGSALWQWLWVVFFECCIFNLFNLGGGDAAARSAWGHSTYGQKKKEHKFHPLLIGLKVGEFTLPPEQTAGI